MPALRASLSSEFVVQIKQKRLGEQADVVETLGGFAGLGQRIERGPDQAEHRHRADRHRRPVPPHEFRRAIKPRLGPGAHGQVFLKASEVFGEFGNAAVMTFGLLAHRLQNDVVEVAGKFAGQAARRRDRRFTDRLRPAQRRIFGEAMGTATGEQLIKDGTQRIDVGGGRDRLAEDLFGGGVVRGHGLQAGRGQGGLAAVGTFQEFGDAEIEQLGGAVGGNENIARF